MIQSGIFYLNDPITDNMQHLFLKFKIWVQENRDKPIEFSLVKQIVELAVLKFFIKSYVVYYMLIYSR